MPSSSMGAPARAGPPGIAQRVQGIFDQVAKLVGYVSFDEDNQVVEELYFVHVSTLMGQCPL